MHVKAIPELLQLIMLLQTRFDIQTESQSSLKGVSETAWHMMGFCSDSIRLIMCSADCFELSSHVVCLQADGVSEVSAVQGLGGLLSEHGSQAHSRGRHSAHAFAL